VADLDTARSFLTGEYDSAGLPHVAASILAGVSPLGARLVKVKGQRVFLDEIGVTDKGGSMKSMNFDCGIFCEEPPQNASDQRGLRA